jgi:hypothetical protein
VDGDLYARSYGGPLYGHASNSSEPTKMEMWFPIVEKAYAQWKGSYDAIGHGGNSGAAVQALTGFTDHSTRWLASADPDQVFAELQEATAAKKCVTAGTFGEDQHAMYDGKGIFADHAYSVLGAVEQDGVKYIQLRNPWGYSEPGHDGTDEGIFLLPVDEFLKMYRDYEIVG